MEIFIPCPRSPYPEIDYTDHNLAFFFLDEEAEIIIQW